MPTWLIVGWAVVMAIVLAVAVFLTIRVRQLEREPEDEA